MTDKVSTGIDLAAGLERLRAFDDKFPGHQFSGMVEEEMRIRAEEDERRARFPDHVHEVISAVMQNEIMMGNATSEEIESELKHWRE